MPPPHQHFGCLLDYACRAPISWSGYFQNNRFVRPLIRGNICKMPKAGPGGLQPTFGNVVTLEPFGCSFRGSERSVWLTLYLD